MKRCKSRSLKEWNNARAEGRGNAARDETTQHTYIHTHACTHAPRVYTYAAEGGGSEARDEMMQSNDI
eukprot:1160694-Pelagomonas_calceolata.AAC.4